MHAQQTKKHKKARGAGFSLLFPSVSKVRFLFVAKSPESLGNEYMYVLRLHSIM